MNPDLSNNPTGQIDGFKQGLFSSKAKVLLLAGGGVILLLFIVLLTSLSLNKGKKSSTGQSQQSNSNSQVKEARTQPFPKVLAGSWTLPKAATTTAPSAARIFTFKEDITLAEFKQFASNFFTKAPVIEEKPDHFSAYVPSNNETNLLFYQRPHGTFLYVSGSGIPLAPGTQAQNNAVAQYVQKAFNDNTLVLTAQYERKNLTNIKYFEFHRSWEKVGFPIFNLLGLFSSSEKTKLASLKLGVWGSNAPKDPSIINTSDGGNGLARPTNFNTVTVGVSNGKIISVTSNIRLINQGNLDQQPLISYEEAVARLKDKQSAQIYTLPSGAGAVDLTKIYPQNTATIDNIVVSDSIVAYLEDLPTTSQQKLTPSYVFRGTGTLKSGYRVNVLATVPATKQAVLGAKTRLLTQETGANSDPSQKQGTIPFEDPTSTPAPRQQQPVESAPISNEPFVALPTQPSIPTCNIGSQGVVDPNDPNKPATSLEGINIQTDTNGNQYFVSHNDLFVIPKTTDISQIVNTVSTGTDYLKTAWDPNLPYETTLQIMTGSKTNGSGTGRAINPGEISVYLGQVGVGCPIAITGYSPTLFIYSSAQRSLTVKPQFPLTYADPVRNQNQWSVDLSGRNLMKVNGTELSYIYYEYSPTISFDKPSKGWVVAKDRLGIFSARLAKALGLNQLEQERLAYELTNSSLSVHANSLFIGLIPQSQVDAKLPIEMSKAPQLQHRLHFYVSPAGGMVVAPQLSVLERASFMILEIGAYTGK